MNDLFVNNSLNLTFFAQFHYLKERGNEGRGKEGKGGEGRRRGEE